MRTLGAGPTSAWSSHMHHALVSHPEQLYATSRPHCRRRVGYVPHYEPKHGAVVHLLHLKFEF